MKKILMMGLLAVVLLAACGGEPVEPQATGPVVTIYKPPT